MSDPAVGIIAREHDIERTGRVVTTPTNNWGKLSYYLKCVSHGCGIDIVDNDLVAYSSAHYLPANRKAALLRIAAEAFNPAHINGILIFDESGTGLCGDSSNEFYKLAQVDTILSLRSTAVIGGQTTQIRKIMVYKRHWLDDYYYNPVRALASNTEYYQSSTSRAATSSTAGDDERQCGWCCCITVIVICVVCALLVW